MTKKKQFRLNSSYTPAGDQPEAIASLMKGFQRGHHEQTLLGVTGSGKTFTMAHVIEHVQKPTLIISHNKTLAAQLYQEFKEFFPDNAVSYFVSYYDYYQPEAYIPQSDTYIEKTTEINEEIDKLRLSATTNLLTRPDTIVVASVSCIYNIGSPREYGQFVLELRKGTEVMQDQIAKRLVALQYERNDWDFKRGTFRIREQSIDIFPSYEDTPSRITIQENRIVGIEKIHTVTGKKEQEQESIVVYPAKHYMTNPDTYTNVFAVIEKDMEEQVSLFQKQKKFVEAQRLESRVTHDLDMIREVGFVNGIENYSRYFDGRNPGDPPNSLLDYFAEAAHMFHPNDPQGWLLFIDESHMTVPQIRGMYNGDRSRKQTLIDYGFRLPAALDNRPLKFDEFLRRIPDTVYVSATPDEWEISRSGQVVEQVVRPTGLLDPSISVYPTTGQIGHLIGEIKKRVKKNERTLVTTLTKRMAEDLTEYLKNLGIRVEYIHADVLTLERTAILSDLRKGDYDVIIGVNLLREGLDIPEVSLVAILDADKEGFLRNTTSLIQTMGRAARHINGAAIIYADTKTTSIRKAIAEIERRRKKQVTYNKAHNVTPTGVSKPIRDTLVHQPQSSMQSPAGFLLELSQEKENAMTPKDKVRYVQKLRTEMGKASREMNFELAAELRDLIIRLSSSRN